MVQEFEHHCYLYKFRVFPHLGELPTREDVLAHQAVILGLFKIAPIATEGEPSPKATELRRTGRLTLEWTHRRCCEICRNVFKWPGFFGSNGNNLCIGCPNNRLQYPNHCHSTKL